MIFHVHFDLVRESDDDFSVWSDLHRVWNLHGGMNIIAFIVQSIITISRSVLCSYCMHVSVDVVTLKIHTMCFSLIYNICTYAWLPIINLLKLKNFILGCCFHLLLLTKFQNRNFCPLFNLLCFSMKSTCFEWKNTWRISLFLTYKYFEIFRIFYWRMGKMNGTHLSRIDPCTWCQLSIERFIINQHLFFSFFVFIGPNEHEHSRSNIDINPHIFCLTLSLMMVFPSFFIECSCSCSLLNFITFIINNWFKYPSSCLQFFGLWSNQTKMIACEYGQIYSQLKLKKKKEKKNNTETVVWKQCVQRIELNAWQNHVLQG